jgi:hypothetical protein
LKCLSKSVYTYNNSIILKSHNPKLHNSEFQNPEFQNLNEIIIKKRAGHFYLRTFLIS